MSAGVGESRVFLAPEGSFSDDPDNPRHPDNCTVNGNPIPVEVRHLLSFRHTDQGIAEAAEEAASKPHAHTRVIRDEFHNRINRRGGDLDRGMAEEAHDPMKELVNLHVPDGMRPLYMSQAQITKEGTTRGYKICMDENGDPVKLGTLVLGYIPEETAARIQRGFERKSEEAQREIYGDDFDVTRPGRTGERVRERFQEQDELSRGRSAPSRSFEDDDPGHSDFGLQADTGEEFKL